MKNKKAKKQAPSEMSPGEVVRMTLEAIESVRKRATHALEQGDQVAYAGLMADLSGLERCLVGESQKLMELFDKEAA